MTEQIREKISSFMDGELEDNSFIAKACDDELNKTWHRYHIISDVMHQRIPVNTLTSLSQNISDSIKQEPTVLSPISKPIPGYVKSIMGMAIAASVAAMAILGIQKYQAQDVQILSQTAQNQRINTQPLNPEYGMPVALSDQESVRIVRTEMQSDPRISRYVINHNTYQSSVGREGLTPVSIFIEQLGNNEPANSTSMYRDAGVNVYSRVSNGLQVTAVGQVSDPTVKRIVESVISTR
jgi:negative regulator of sigma E activity